MKYSPYEIDEILNNMTILVDTREQPNDRFKVRVKNFGKWERCKLDYGDYSCKCLAGEDEISLASKVVIERKMNADELAACLGRERKRFERELERAKADGAKIILLVENEDWQSLYEGLYRSKLPAKSLVATLHTWQARYRLSIQFCKDELTGAFIKDLFRYELREVLKNE